MSHTLLSLRKNELMPSLRTSTLNTMVVVMLLALFECGMPSRYAVAANAFAEAPTIPDAHQYIESQVSNSGVTALYETRNMTGAFLGYETFPVLGYKGAQCKTELTLKNEVKVEIDWSVLKQPKSSDGTLNILNGQDVEFRFFHLVWIEGGVVVEPSKPIPRLLLGVNDELSRNRLLKATELLSSACRSKSKFD